MDGTAVTDGKDGLDGALVVLGWDGRSLAPTPVPPTPHPVHLYHLYHPSHPCSNQPMHKTMCPHPAIMIQSNLADPIQPIRSRSSDIQKYNPADTIQPANTIRSDFSTKQQSQPIPILSCLTASASSYTIYPSDDPSSDFLPSPSCTA